jgi:hypothetical protein
LEGAESDDEKGFYFLDAANSCRAVFKLPCPSFFIIPSGRRKFQMTSLNLKHWSGLAALMGGGLFVVLSVVESVIFGNQPDVEAALTGAWIIVQVSYLVAALLALLGLVGLYVDQAQEAGTLGLIAFVLAFVGGMMATGSAWSEAFFGGWLARSAPELLSAEPSGALAAGVLLTYVLFTLGWFLFGLASLRAGVLPRGAAVVLMIGALWFLVSDIAGLPLSMVIYGAALAWMGFALWSGTAQQPLVTEPAT